MCKEENERVEEAAGPPRGGLRVGQRGPRLTLDLLHGLPLLGLSFLPVRRGQPAHGGSRRVVHGGLDRLRRQAQLCGAQGRRGAGRGLLTALVDARLGTKMALKFVNKSKTKLKNFLREVSITNSLSSSPFIIKVFDVVFETEDCYVFAQEYAPAGDLFDIIPPQVPGWWLREGRGSSGSPSVRAEEESGHSLKSFIRRLLYISHWRVVDTQ